jgi:hypothetical protein
VTVFGEAGFTRELRERFVCVAVNQHHHRRRADLEREIFARLVQQTGEEVNGTNQGLYFFTPAAELLSFSNTVDGAHALRLLRRALEKFAPQDGVPELLRDVKEAGPLWKPPEGTVVVEVTSKVLGGYGEAKRRHDEIHQASLGRDWLWIAREEAAELAAGRLPETLKSKLPRFLIDNTRGEPGGWRAEDLRKLEVKLDGGRLAGAVHLETRDGKKGFEAALLGIVEAKDGRLSRFDVVVKGDYRGEGTYSRGAPKGKFPFAVAFRISPGTGAADPAPPGAR